MSRGGGPLTGIIRPEPVPVWITTSEFEDAERAGEERYEQNVRRKRKDRRGNDSVRSHVSGIAGELAGCRLLGHQRGSPEWERCLENRDDASTYNTYDIAPNWQVRTKRQMKAVEVKDTDDDNWIVLAISYYDLAPLAGFHRFYSWGSIPVSEVKGRFKLKENSWWVPIRMLKHP